MKKKRKPLMIMLVVTTETLSAEDRDALRGYQIYEANMTQSGTDAPAVSVLQNTIGNIVWTYSGVGVYIGTLAAAFPAGKVVAFISGVAANTARIVRTSDNTIQVTTGTGAPANGILTETSIEIRIHNIT